MATIRVHGEEPFEFELTDEELAVWEATAKARGQTLGESFEEIVREFIASHPVIEQTRTVQ